MSIQNCLNHSIRIIFFLTFLSPTLVIHSQQTNISLTGTVTDAANHAPLEFSHVELYDHNHKLVALGTVSSDGSYTITVGQPGEYRLKASFMGYHPEIRENLKLKSGEKYTYSFQLSENSVSLNEVTIKGLSESERIQRLAYNVSMMETGKLKNTTLNLAKMIDKISGVKIRETGGVGSDVRVSLNGFSGKHVKIFIDGVPMDGMGSAFGLNNIPIGLAKRVEVYKGVVPIELGGDALGGAINIVTDNSRHTRINASYSYGSFNTHRSNVYAEHTTQNGIYMSVNAYQNYSDNNFKVDVPLVDFSTGIYADDNVRLPQFHANYHNEAVVTKAGVVNKSWADRLLLGFIGGYEYKEQQHAATRDRVFGGRYSTATTLMPTFNYTKKFNILKGLHIALDGTYNFGKSYQSDTASYKYNWRGESQYVGQNVGEVEYSKYHYQDHNATANFRMTLFPAKGHALSIASTLNSFSRSGHDEVEKNNTDNHPQRSLKDVTGLNYKYDHNGRWNVSGFVKNYMNYLEAYLDPTGEDIASNYRNHSATKMYWGGGFAGTWFANEQIQLKASYEHALRLPTSRELFGDGDGIEQGTTNLKPENSDNYNLGITVHPISNPVHSLTVDATASLRMVKDYIRRTINESKGTATSSNHGKVRSWGMDASVRYTYKELFFAGGNMTYVDMRNMEQTVAGTTYKDRMPNEPWLYGNAEAGITLRNLFQKGSLFDIHYMLSYVHDFTYDWSNYGGDVVPTQLSHDLYISYTFGRQHAFTVSAECHNIFDERLYDNYNLEKPGRSFAIRIGYSFNR